jgi:hypothetical protein
LGIKRTTFDDVLQVVIGVAESDYKKEVLLTPNLQNGQQIMLFLLS